MSGDVLFRDSIIQAGRGNGLSTIYISQCRISTTADENERSQTFFFSRIKIVAFA